MGVERLVRHKESVLGLTLQQLHYNIVAPLSDLACKGHKGLLRDATELIWSKFGQGRNLLKKHRNFKSTQNGLAYGGKF